MFHISTNLFQTLLFVEKYYVFFEEWWLSVKNVIAFLTNLCLYEIECNVSNFDSQNYVGYMCFGKVAASFDKKILVAKIVALHGGRCVVK